MAHRSRVCAVIFDVASGDYENAARFWSSALGRELAFDPKEKYTPLRGEFDYLIQKVGAGREGMHIDFETDDVEAEVERLEALGACRRKQVKNWWVMEAPDGQPFCVVPVHSAVWPKGAIDWE